MKDLPSLISTAMSLFQRLRRLLTRERKFSTSEHILQIFCITKFILAYFLYTMTCFNQADFAYKAKHCCRCGHKRNHPVMIQEQDFYMEVQHNTYRTYEHDHPPASHLGQSPHRHIRSYWKWRGKKMVSLWRVSVLSTFSEGALGARYISIIWVHGLEWATRNGDIFHGHVIFRLYTKIKHSLTIRRLIHGTHQHHIYGMNGQWLWNVCNLWNNISSLAWRFTHIKDLCDANLFLQSWCICTTNCVSDAAPSSSSWHQIERETVSLLGLKPTGTVLETALSSHVSFYEYYSAIGLSISVLKQTILYIYW